MFKKIKEKFQFDKQVLNKFRFNLKYIYAPIYGFFNILLFTICFVLFAKEKSIYYILALLILSFCSTAIMLIYIRRLNKKEVLIEADNIKNFFQSVLLENPSNKYDLSLENGETVEVTLLENNICISNVIYPKNSFRCFLYTSNYMYQVNLILVFEHIINNEGEGQENNGVSFSLPLNIHTLSVLKKYNIELENPDILKFIKDNPELAAAQILKYGKIQDNYKQFIK